MTPSYILGLDIAKRQIRFHLTDAAGHHHVTGAVPTTAAGLAALLSQLKACGAPAAVAVVMETTGLLHVPWAEALSARGFTVYAVNALVAHRVQPLANVLRQNKTDRLDAAGLADLGRRYPVELERFHYASQPNRFGLQRLFTVRQQLRAHLTNLRKAYGGLLDLVFPELSGLLQQRIHGRRVRALLAAAPTPESLRRCSLPQLRRAFGGRTDAVLAAARLSLATPALAAATAPALQAMLSSLASLESQLATLDMQLQAHSLQVVNATQLAHVRTVPGIGLQAGLKIAAYLPARFWQPAYWQRHPSRRRATAQALAFMGAEPRVAQSGCWKGRARMSKRGCEPLRTALYQASFCGKQRDPQLAALYARQQAKGKAHKVCLSHLMRLQTQRVITVLQTGRAWSSAPVEISPHASTS